MKEAHDAYVIGFGEFNSKMDKFLHTHQHDIYLPTFIFASVESESLCYFDEHVLITRSNWIRGGQESRTNYIHYKKYFYIPLRSSS